jgi:hypothetical protein
MGTMAKFGSGDFYKSIEEVNGWVSGLFSSKSYQWSW